MSSFIVGKIEYVKVAGLMYGIEEAKRDPHRWFLENVRKEFEHCYLLNVISFNRQYGDSVVPEEDGYDAEFEAMRRVGRRIYGETDTRRMTLEKLRPMLQEFFQSVLYQIEDDACERAVSAWFYKCVAKLYQRELNDVEGWWGRIDDNVLLAA